MAIKVGRSQDVQELFYRTARRALVPSPHLAEFLIGLLKESPTSPLRHEEIEPTPPVVLEADSAQAIDTVIRNIAYVGFGVPDTTDPHCFEVHIPRGKGMVRIVEHYGVAASASGRLETERCVMARSAWTAIADDVKRIFNERLKEKHLTVGAWKTTGTKVERLLGQELLVLAWAVEAAEPEMIPAAVRNWMALRPEERWWLYAVTVASTGEPKHAGIGWRKALRIALTEN